MPINASVHALPPLDRRPIPRIELPVECWAESAHPEREGTCRSRLFASLQLNDTLLHCEAIEVRVDGSMQVAADAAWEDTLNSYAIACSPDGPFETTTIRGREYAVFCTPYC